MERAMQTVIYQVKDGVATLTLNRPDRLNAFNGEMLREISEIWAYIRQDPDVRAVIIRAAGDRAFCTGVDTSMPRKSEAERDRPFDLDDPGEQLGAKQNRVWKPVICAVNGMCAGGAFYLLNEADIVICADDATFFDPHVSIGLVAAVEQVGLVAKISLAEALRMALMGNSERICAETALRMSLVTEIVPAATLWDRANEIARLLASRHPVAVQGTVRAAWESRDLPHSQAVTNAFKYSQLGNPISRANPADIQKERWRLR
jgi:enoyl-CoA hydratase/carnithine racemase